MIKKLSGIGLSLVALFVVGCASQGTHKTAASYSTLCPPQPPSWNTSLIPVSNPSPASRRVAPSPADLALGAEIRALLMDDKSLAPAPSNVITVVSGGVVKMTGYIRSRRAAQELHQRIASLPGVVSVEDQLTLWNGHKI